jgi:acyl carrier protein
MASIETTVRDFIVANFLFGDLERLVPDDASLLERGIIDSTGILELVFFLETAYGIKVADAEMVPDNLDSVARVARFVERKAGKAA